MAGTLLNRNDRRRFTLFFTCLGVSVLLWLFYTLSATYEYSSQTAIRYINQPVNKAFHPLQPDTVQVAIEGSGWQLLFDKMRFNPSSIDADLRDLGQKDHIIFSQQLARLNRRIGGYKIVSITPDTLYFDFSARSEKRVPVRLVQQVQFKKQFGPPSAIRLNPGYVTITGPAAALAKISSWPTDSLKLADVSHSATLKLRLRDDADPAVDVFPQEITAAIPVDEFTEKELVLPLKVLNAGNRQVKVLPSTVKVIVMSALSTFHDESWDRTGAVVDLGGWLSEGLPQLPVRLVNVPPFTRIVKIDPQTVDFLVSN